MTCNKCERPSLSRGMCATHYMGHRNRMKAYGKWESKFVPSDRARLHYQELLEAGMHRNQVSRLSGIKTGQLDNLLRPRKGRGDQPAQRVIRSTQDRLLAVTVPAPHQVWRWAAAGAPVDGTGTTRRLQALVALGWTQSSLTERLGVLPSNATALFHGTRKPVAGTARDVAALFNELQWTPGTSTRARTYAARRGWLPPLAWDEDLIDNPDSHPAVDDEPITGVDHVAVDRAVNWLTTRPTWDNRTPEWRAWRAQRPALTRAEKLEVAERLTGELSVNVVCESLSLRKTDLPESLGVAA